MDNDQWQEIVRMKLNAENIKLWLPPYTSDKDTPGNYPEDLIKKFCSDLQLPETTVTAILEKLRLQALQNLDAREKFQQTGLATLKIKAIKNDSEKSDGPIIFNLEIMLSDTGKNLKDLIEAKIGLKSSNLKAICKGQVLADERILEQQGVRNSSLVMVLDLGSSKEQMKEEEESVQEINRTREDAQLLASVDVADPSSDHYLDVTDQNGKSFPLPPEERKALSLAMTFHEKGRAKMKKTDYSAALVYFLEADKEFLMCKADILNAVDNYALLNLDITWCYLCLHSIAHLPDGDNRLKKAEDCFKRSYGANMERLQAVKGTTGNEEALFARLYLLKGIVAYHQNKFEDARSFLLKAAQAIQKLKVDDEKLTQVMLLGYSVAEARIGLRFSQGDLQLAINHILHRREERDNRRKLERLEHQQKQKQKSLGKTLNGEWINPDFYSQLISMGYSKKLAKAALANSNNNISGAVQILQDNPELLINLPDTSESTSSPMDIDINPNVADEVVAKMISLGFNEDLVRGFLKDFKGDIKKFVEDIVGGTGNVPQELLDMLPSTSQSSESITDTQNFVELSEAADRLAEDIPTNEDDYLDINLAQEEEFLNQYFNILNSIPVTNK